MLECLRVTCCFYFGKMNGWTQVKHVSDSSEVFQTDQHHQTTGLLPHIYLLFVVMYQGLQQFWMYFLETKGISIKLLTTSQSMCSCYFLLFEISHSTSIFRPVKNPSFSMWTPCQARQNGWIFLLSTNLMGPEIHKSTLFSIGHTFISMRTLVPAMLGKHRKDI